MPNSLKAKLSKLRYKCQITDEEYKELIAKLDGHDAEIRAEEREKVIKECKEVLRHYAFKEDDDDMYIKMGDLEQLREQKNGI